CQLFGQWAGERGHGRCYGRRHTSIVFDCVLIKGVALRGVKIERATKIHRALRRAIGDQRNCNARCVGAFEGGDSPSRKPRIRPNVIDTTSFTGPNRNARWTLTCFRLSPGNLDARQVIQTISRLCHRPNSLLGIIFAIADPGQPKLTARHENFTNGLQQLLLAFGLKQHTVALVKSPYSPVEPVQNLLVGFALLWHLTLLKRSAAQVFAGQSYSRPSTLLADRKSTRLNSSHQIISYAVFCLKKKNRLDNIFVHYY